MLQIQRASKNNHLLTEKWEFSGVISLLKRGEMLIVFGRETNSKFVSVSFCYIYFFFKKAKFILEESVFIPV